MSQLLDSFGEREEVYADDVLRDLLERKDRILEMQSTVGWELWRDYLAHCAESYQNRLLLGTHKDMLDYRYDAGVLKGLRLALSTVDQLEQTIAAQRSILAGIADTEEPL